MEPSPRNDVWAAGVLYEPYVGRWSRLVARELLKWLSIPVQKDKRRQEVRSVLHAVDDERGPHLDHLIVRRPAGVERIVERLPRPSRDAMIPELNCHW